MNTVVWTAQFLLATVLILVQAASRLRPSDRTGAMAVNMMLIALCTLVTAVQG
ncbi:hypothetical protein [Streptomyces sp. S.PB5]|uniref:hypothetical protein n=1 Tax=Streptomyces sp. S.PB5 TaxID=3020844 RepID=UPI0025AED4BE|nr:hypothetical protein [Streptomyces sp. S.PB5]MDN3022970.1 hypothetical protein [Streptomyces sp. S.PB5]